MPVGFYRPTRILSANSVRLNILQTAVVEKWKHCVPLLYSDRGCFLCLTVLASWLFPSPPPPHSSCSLLGWCSISSLAPCSCTLSWSKCHKTHRHVTKIHISETHCDIFMFTALLSSSPSYLPLVKPMPGLTQPLKHFQRVKFTLSDLSQKHFLLYASLIFISCLVFSPVVSCVFLSCLLLLLVSVPLAFPLSLWPPLLWWVCKNSLQRTGPGCTLRYTMAQSLRPCQMGIGKERQ